MSDEKGEKIWAVGKGERMLTAQQFQALAEVPPEAEWFTSLNNPHTRRAYRLDIRDFMAFVGIAEPSEFRQIRRAHVLAWRSEIKRRSLGSSTTRRKLSALSSLMAYLCNQNAINENPVAGVARPREGSNQGKTAALGNEQARVLLNAPDPNSLKGVRDRAILAALLFHALRRSELCALKIKDYTPRQGILQFSVLGKGEKIRYVPVAPETITRIEAYLDFCGHREDFEGPLFRPVKNNSTKMLRKHINPNSLYSSVVLYHARKVGVFFPGLRPHSMRATAITNALEHGVDLSKAQDWAGHADPSTTRLYDKRIANLSESPSFKIDY